MNQVEVNWMGRKSGRIEVGIMISLEVGEREERIAVRTTKAIQRRKAKVNKREKDCDCDQFEEDHEYETMVR